jgi:hypothetical protein
VQRPAHPTLFAFAIEALCVCARLRIEADDRFEGGVVHPDPRQVLVHQLTGRDTAVLQCRLDFGHARIGDIERCVRRMSLTGCQPGQHECDARQ